MLAGAAVFNKNLDTALVAYAALNEVSRFERNFYIFDGIEFFKD